jgi:uncharacterized DUF497 family protein
LTELRVSSSIPAFEWDEEKAKANYRKHGIGFETATEVFDDPFAVEIVDELSGDHGEERLLITGLSEGNLILRVVYTERGDRIRIISARRATKVERDDYHNQNAKD